MERCRSTYSHPKLSDNNEISENLNTIKGAETMQDFFKQQADWLSTWQEQQQKLTKQYASWGEDLTQGGQGARQGIPTNFEELLKSQQELFEQFTSFGANLQQNLQQSWGDKLPTELLRLFNFNIMQEFYKGWLGNMKFPGGLQNPFMGGQSWADPSSFLNNYMKQDHPFLSAFSNRNLTEELQQLFGLFQGAKVPGGDIFSQLFTTYQGFFNQLSSTASGQGFDKLLESFSRWQEQADQYLLAPQVGINRESAQDFSKAVSLSFDYLKSYAVMGKLIEETARKSGNRFQVKLVERSLNNEPPIKFNDFCSLWTKENEAVFLEVFGSEEFAKTQREFTSAGLRLKIQINKLVENVLDQTPIALKRDVDLAAGEILQLKRDLRKARKQQQELAAEAKAAKLAVEASEKRFAALEEALVKVQALAEANRPPEKPPAVKAEKAPAATPKTATAAATKTTSRARKSVRPPAEKK